MSTAAHSEYLTTSQAAKLLGIDRGKIADWIAVGDLAAVNVALRTGGQPRWRIRRTDLDAFLLHRASQGAANAK
jgi:excisionase family DNA binding protein